MCKECRVNPCHPRCPNAPEPPTVFVCSGCSDPIYDGDTVWHILGEQFCGQCIDKAREIAEYDPD